VFGKELPGYVRGMGFGILPCKLERSSKSSLGGASSYEIQRLKFELQASNARVKALEEEVTNNPRVRALEEQMALLMQKFGSQFQQNDNQ
ncbi:hypothetical protein RYX36_018481, partial [Vicia faba]